MKGILIVGSDVVARVWDANAGTELFRHDVEIVALAGWSPGGKHIVTQA